MRQIKADYTVLRGDLTKKGILEVVDECKFSDATTKELKKIVGNFDIARFKIFEYPGICVEFGNEYFEVTTRRDSQYHVNIKGWTKP